MENKKYQQVLIQQAKLQNSFYTYNSNLQPCAYFWKQLVKGKQTPQLFIPDTLLLNDKQNPLIWIYTNSKGKLEKSVNINLKDFVNKITNYCSPNQLSAVLKRVTHNDNSYINGNDVKLLNSRYLQNVSLQQLGGQSQGLITLQRYVKSNGNNAFICRTIWRKNKHSEVFVITNKKSFYDESQPENKRFLVRVASSSRGQASPSTIIKAIQGQHLAETCKYLTSITDFMKLYRGVIFSEMVGDFVKDQSGNWWLINIKAFQVEQKFLKCPSLMNEGRLTKKVSQCYEKQYIQESYEKQKYQKTKICRYCEKSYLQSQLTHYITIRMLIQTDRYLLHLGKNYKWLKRSDIQNVDSHCLYQEHKICQRCYRLYTEIQQLMEIQNEFLKNLGFAMEKKPKQLLMSLTNEEELKTESKNKQLATLAQCFQAKQNAHNIASDETQNILNQSKKVSTGNGFPKTIELGPNSNIIFENDTPIKNDHMINKMIRYRMTLYLKQLDQIQFPQFLRQDYHNYNFFLEYEFFGVKNKIKLDFGAHYNMNKKTLSIKKLKINYFFSHSHQDVYQYLSQKNDQFTINIFIEQIKSSKNDSIHEKNSLTGSSFKKKLPFQQMSSIQRDSFEDTVMSGHNSKVTNSQNSSTKDYFLSNSISNSNKHEKKMLIGKLRLPITYFFNNLMNPNSNKITKKDFYNFFSVNDVAHGWGLEGSVGIIPCQSYVNTSRMIFFTKDALIYLPNDNYYYCEPLPQEWIDIIKKELINGNSGNYNLNENILGTESVEGKQSLQKSSSFKLTKKNANQINSRFKKQPNLSIKKTAKGQNLIKKASSNEVQFLDQFLQDKKSNSESNKSKDCELSLLKKQKSKIRLNKQNQDSTIIKEGQHDLKQQSSSSSSIWKDELLKNQILKYERRNKLSTTSKIHNINSSTKQLKF